MSSWTSNPHLVVQAKNAKKSEAATPTASPGSRDGSQKLEEERRPAPTDRVFRGIFPKRETFRHDLKRAGIQNIEDPLGKLHFHSLRHTMNHRLQENGGCSDRGAALDAAQHPKPDHKDVYQLSGTAACGGNKSVPAIVSRNRNRHTYRHTKTSRSLSFSVTG